MPELPEVEVVKESLSRTITGKKIKKVSIKNRNLRFKIKKGFETRLQSKLIIIINIVINARIARSRSS